MKFAVCNEMFEGRSYDEQLEIITECGYEAVELAPFTFAKSVTDIPAEERQRLATRPGEFGLQVAGIHWVLVGPEGLHMSDVDEDVHGRTIAYLRDLVRFCHGIGGEIIVFGSPNQRSIPPGLTKSMAWDRFMHAVLEGMSIPEADDVYFCLEPLTKQLTDFLNTPDEVARMLREIDHPRVKMILDTYSMNADGIDMPAAIRKHRDWLYHVHVNDDNQLGPGYGSIDFVPVLKALEDIGYERYVSVEIFDFSRDTVEVARNSLAHLKKCLERVAGGDL